MFRCRSLFIIPISFNISSWMHAVTFLIASILFFHLPVDIKKLFWSYFIIYHTKFPSLISIVHIGSYTDHQLHQVIKTADIWITRPISKQYK